MTSTQRSESANHMLKNYVPPVCPMHMFVQKYMMLLFDRESDENYEEKRSTIGRLLMGANLAVERHASKIYTRLCLINLDTYCMSVGLIRLKKLKNIRHTSRSIVKQRKGRSGQNFCTRLQCLMGATEIDCECAQFAYKGLLCSHVLKVDEGCS
ncbi:hypothetical protein ACQJBY_058122 [Aegilops geniculata]